MEYLHSGIALETVAFPTLVLFDLFLKITTIQKIYKSEHLIGSKQKMQQVLISATGGMSSKRIIKFPSFYALCYKLKPSNKHRSNLLPLNPKSLNQACREGAISSMKLEYVNPFRNPSSWPSLNIEVDMNIV